jgi:hypothetical protein
MTDGKFEVCYDTTDRIAQLELVRLQVLRLLDVTRLI